MYKFYNNNALGLFENDCVIRSISLATNNTWDDTYEHLSNIARIKGTMMDDKDFVRWYLDNHFTRVYNPPYKVYQII